MKCKKCKGKMMEQGFRWHNLKYKCNNCRVYFFPFSTRIFGKHDFAGLKWIAWEEYEEMFRN